MRQKLTSENETIEFLNENRDRIKAFMIEQPRTKSEIAEALSVSTQHFRDIFTTASIAWPIYEIDEDSRNKEPLYGWLK